MRKALVLLRKEVKMPKQIRIVGATPKRNANHPFAPS
jgi:hypothetical protein